MDSTAIKALMAEIAPVIRDYVAESVSEAIAPVSAEVTNLGGQVKGLQDGEPAMPECVMNVMMTMVDKQTQRALAELRKGLGE